MKTVHGLVVLIAVVAGSLYAVQHVAAAEVDIASTSSCVAGNVVLDFLVTNNSSMSVTASYPPFLAPITVVAGATQAIRMETSLPLLVNLTYQIPYTRQDGTKSATSVTLQAIDCSVPMATTGKVYLPLINR